MLFVSRNTFRIHNWIYDRFIFQDLLQKLAAHVHVNSDVNQIRIQRAITITLSVAKSEFPHPIYCQMRIGWMRPIHDQVCILFCFELILFEVHDHFAFGVVINEVPAKSAGEFFTQDGCGERTRCK